MTAFSFKANDRRRAIDWQPVELAGEAPQPHAPVRTGLAIKGLIVPEHASTEDPAQPGRKAQYPNCRWFVNSSQASLTAFRALAADVLYRRTEQP